jgi:RNA polymerase sigma-70 factor (ECF subfamily)
MPDLTPIPGDPEGEAPSPSDTSFALLVQQYQPKLLQFIRRYTNNQQDAEDLTQDTFVKAFRYFSRYDSKYAFSSWLYTIARRTVYNHYRSARYAEPLEFEIIDGSESPSDAAEQADFSDSIWKAARSLKPEYQEALTLKYVEDLSVR